MESYSIIGYQANRMSKQPHPPRWAQIFLRWYCKPSLLEDLEGDLNEYFYRHCDEYGPRRARLIYILDVIKFFRTYTVRKPEFINLLLHWIMIGSYFRTSGRSLVRHKLFSAINIVGLAVSMSVSLVLIGVLLDAFSYDRFHEHHARIYRVISRYEYLGKKDANFLATTSLKTGQSVSENFPGAEHVAILQRGLEGDVQTADKKVPLTGYWSGQSLWDVFSFPLIQGNPATALRNPFSLVLTETAAYKLFGDEPALGKVVQLQDHDYTITGIIKDLPHVSHIRFDMLASLSTRALVDKQWEQHQTWDNVWGTWVYVLMEPQANLDQFQANLADLSRREDPSVKHTHIELALQPMDAIMTGENLSNEIGPTLGSTLLWIFSALAFVVILSACFNYANLSIARSMQRSREVGIRKVVGAMRTHIVLQFMVEGVVISLLALMAAIGIFLVLRPHFLSLETSLTEILRLELTPLRIGLFVIFAIIMGMVAGMLPAFFFVRINAIQVLKDASIMRVFRKVTLRKALIVFQYALSLMFITGTLIIFRQYDHFINFDLGYNTENILNIRMQGTAADVLKKEIQELPEVVGVAGSGMVTSVGYYWGTKVKNPLNPEDSADMHMNFVDEHYLPLMEHQLVAGRNFTPHAPDARESEVIVNESALKRFEIGKDDPAQALGMIIRVDGIDMQIVGVMRDFQYGRANNESNSQVVLRYNQKNIDVLSVKIQSDNIRATYAKLEQIWKKLDPVHPFNAQFYQEEIEKSFRGLSATVKLAGFIAFLAICIASLGLLGMVVFTTETRVREIGIRKVLGATDGSLIYLMSRSFMWLLVIAVGIALPLTYIFFDQILLPNFVNYAPLTWKEGLLAAVVVSTLAVIMIVSQTIKVARSNPASVLKSE